MKKFLVLAFFTCSIINAENVASDKLPPFLRKQCNSTNEHSHRNACNILLHYYDKAINYDVTHSRENELEVVALQDKDSSLLVNIIKKNRDAVDKDYFITLEPNKQKKLLDAINTVSIQALKDSRVGSREDSKERIRELSTVITTLGIKNKSQ
jgi:hypothetical protein